MNDNKNYRAVADLGSNTFHLIIGNAEADIPEVIFQQREAVGIGRNGMTNREITADALERGLKVLEDFSQQVLRHGLAPSETLVLATSAFRNARNTGDVLRQIQDRTGFSPQVISGEDEAAYIFAGVRASGAVQEGIPSLIMDIGGGSVEFILWDGSRQSWKRSFEIGGLRLVENFHHTDPLPEPARRELEHYLETELQPLWEAAGNLDGLRLIGSSGSFDTLDDVRNAMQDSEWLKGSKSAFEILSLDEFETIFQKVWHLPLEERTRIPGMTAFRAGIISVALILIRLVLQKTGAEEIVVSHYAMKEGALFGQFSHA